MGRVAVLGSLNVDVVTRVARLPGPGETVLGESAGRFAGGKGGNQAMAARRAGADVVMIGRVGADDAGAAYLDRLNRHGVRTEVPQCADAPTGTAYITLDEHGENVIIVVPGANERVEEQSVTAAALGPGDVLLCTLEVPAAVVAGAARQAAEAGARVIINLAPYTWLPHDVIDLADPLVVNESEMRELADSDLIPGSLLVTFGAAGARWDGEEVSGIRLDDADVVDTVGAGDAFCGALAAALAAGGTRREALEAANRAGAEAVQWTGAQPDAAL
ncbi:ribokinase [Intrasporangium sp. DVR]|uniref:ribokinase n=1 Tax=Intrasporangium sp. DVR TaxID=3127867 RepID=UPI00313A552A